MHATMRQLYPSPGNKHSERGVALHKACEEAMQEYLMLGTETFPHIEATLPRADVTDFRTAIGHAIDMIAADSGVKVYTESKVKGDALGYPEVFGTADLVVVSPSLRMLSVYDYKFGHGVHDFIPQLTLYAWMALHTPEVKKTEGITDVCLCVIQPATGRIPRKTILAIDEVFDWADKTFTPAYTRAASEAPEAIPSAEACRYCPGAAGRCPALQKEMTSVFDVLEQPAEDAVAKLGLSALLKKLDLAAAYRKHVAEEIMRELKEGRPVDGLKLVYSRTNRVWGDEGKAGRWMAARGLPKEERYTYKLLTPPQAEKKLKVVLGESDKTKRAFEKLIVRPQGELTFAPADDPREAVTPQSAGDATKNFEIEV